MDPHHVLGCQLRSKTALAFEAVHDARARPGARLQVLDRNRLSERQVHRFDHDAVAPLGDPSFDAVFAGDDGGIVEARRSVTGRYALNGPRERLLELTMLLR